VTSAGFQVVWRASLFLPWFGEVPLGRGKKSLDKMAQKILKYLFVLHVPKVVVPSKVVELCLDDHGDFVDCPKEEAQIYPALFQPTSVDSSKVVQQVLFVEEFVSICFIPLWLNVSGRKDEAARYNALRAGAVFVHSWRVRLGCRWKKWCREQWCCPK